MKNIGLVLEGGGTRGVYSTGVLDAFLEYGIEVPYVIGVSIGAYNGAAYIAKQKKRNYKVYTEYINDERLINFKRLIKGESVLNSRFVFEFINRDKHFFNYDNFFNSKNTFISVSTDCITGKPVYFEKDKYEKTDVDDIIRSSCSLPFLSEIVKYKDQNFLDGGIADSIPVRKAILDGNKKIIAILTHPKGFEEKQGWYHKISSFWYPKFPNLTKAIKYRYLYYNESIQILEMLEKLGKAYIIRPKNINASMIEHDIDKLNKYYKIGWMQGVDEIQKVKDFLGA
ncbi:patatin-like phospholipase family protein [Psychrilyobacter atlanticus]|uniref:patatin-like phospholipase family protein n=1 Tax=Psychrilyobacter atlanticus TaxID=271091 RepID=UPI0004006649|nr:patatin family protein [Psychrilyobacter atlanticus]